MYTNPVLYVRCKATDRKHRRAAGKGQPSELTQLSSLYVEAVEKKPGAAKTKHFHGDAGKVVATGNGLKKGFPGRPCTFNLEAKDAGTQFI